VNFEIARVLKRNKIEARVWERGVGETLSCGSGACATAVIARIKGYIDDEVDIMLEGGDLTVYWNGEGEVYLSGPVEEVFNGEWPR
jgi:diaminopimelate epimerase